MNVLLDDFDAGKLSLSALTHGLESEIESWGFHGDEANMERLRTVWWSFEVPNARLRDDDRSSLSSDERADVAAASSDLRAELRSLSDRTE
jgi:hypothetical protein